MCCFVSESRPARSDNDQGNVVLGLREIVENVCHNIIGKFLYLKFNLFPRVHVTVQNPGSSSCKKRLFLGACLWLKGRNDEY